VKTRKRRRVLAGGKFPDDAICGAEAAGGGRITKRIIITGKEKGSGVCPSLRWANSGLQGLHCPKEGGGGLKTSQGGGLEVFSRLDDRPTPVDRARKLNLCDHQSSWPKLGR